MCSRLAWASVRDLLFLTHLARDFFENLRPQIGERAVNNAGNGLFQSSRPTVMYATQFCCEYHYGAISSALVSFLGANL